jgi:hypothetical protein
MEKIEKGLALEELEAQTAELLPDRLEMHRRRRRRGSRIRRNASEGFRCSPVNVQVGDFENEIDQDVVCFRIDT